MLVPVHTLPAGAQTLASAWQHTWLGTAQPASVQDTVPGVQIGPPSGGAQLASLSPVPVPGPVPQLTPRQFHRHGSAMLLNGLAPHVQVVSPPEGQPAGPEHAAPTKAALHAEPSVAVPASGHSPVPEAEPGMQHVLLSSVQVNAAACPSQSLPALMQTPRAVSQAFPVGGLVPMPQLTAWQNQFVESALPHVQDTVMGPLPQEVVPEQVVPTAFVHAVPVLMVNGVGHSIVALLPELLLLPASPPEDRTAPDERARGPGWLQASAASRWAASLMDARPVLGLRVIRAVLRNLATSSRVDERAVRVVDACVRCRMAIVALRSGKTETAAPRGRAITA